MKSYRRYLRDTQDELQQAIAEAEDAGWHHEADATDEFRHYLRLLTWEKAITERMVVYAAAKRNSALRKARRTVPEARGVLERLGGQRNDPGGRARLLEPGSGSPI